MDNYNFYNDKGGIPKRRGYFSYLVVGIIGAVIGGMLVLTFAPAALLGRVVPEESNKPAEIVGERILIPQEKDVNITTAIAKKVNPAVVGIRTTKYEKDMFFGRTKVEGVGSGVIVDRNGYVLTNNHVADEVSDITVFLIDGSSVPGRIVWTDPGLDLSIVKIEAHDLPAAEMGNSDELEVGELAVAIGNPLGLRFERSVTEGIISALNRTIPVENDKFMEDLIQTDASINQGNSGGPLINSQGKVIGINTVKVTSAEGMGFAIPINIAVPVIKSIVETGSFKTPYIGVTGLDKEIASFYGYDINEGIFVANIDKDGPAYEAGIRSGDIILGINDNPVNTLTSLKQNIYGAGVGSSITIKYKDKSGTMNMVTTVLGELRERN